MTNEELITQYNEIISRVKEIKEAYALCNGPQDNDVVNNLRIEVLALVEELKDIEMQARFLKITRKNLEFDI